MRFLAPVVFLFVLTSARAQGTFRIYDSSMNDVTSSYVFVLDTNSGMMSVTLSVQNTDSVPHDVTAGRVVIAQPASASNAFTWGMYQYTPANDTSVIPIAIAATAMDTFVGYYFTDSLGGVATIDYCFWETTNPGNSSCVTLYYENHIHAGIQSRDIPAVLAGPNPAPEFIGFSWSHLTMTTIEIYSSTGELLAIRHLDQGESAEFEITNWAPGLYLYNIYGTEGVSMTGTFVH